MSGGLEAIERLIHEYDAKFMEKLKACYDGANVNLAATADRTFNLRQQVAHSAVLMGDDHFVSMLEDVELCLAPEYTLKGELDDKLYAYLAGLLKTLLREAISVQSFAARKIQIEMTWHWYQDKKSQIVGFAVERCAGFRPRAPQQTEETVAERERRLAEEQANREEREASSRRDAAPSKARASATQKLFKIATRPSTTPEHGRKCPRLHFADEAKTNEEQAAIAKKLTLFKTHNLSKSSQLREEVRAAGVDRGIHYGDAVRVVYKERAKQRQQSDSIRQSVAGPSGPSPYLHVPAQAPTFNPPSAAQQRPTVEANLAVANQRVVNHLVAKMEDEHAHREMLDAQYVLAYQQARMEEETGRRLESEAYGSQTGRTCHTILRRLPRETGEQPTTVKSQQPSATLEAPVAAQLLGQKIAPATLTEESLSAYDHMQPSAMDELKLKALLNRVATTDDDAAKGSSIRKKAGLKSPMPEAMAGTSAKNRRLDLVVSDSTVVGPMAPNTNLPIMELLNPILAMSDDVPSLRRLEQLQLVERVRDCFARTKNKRGEPINVPRSVIERALVGADDRPIEECLRLLPRPGSDFPSNPFPDASKEKKGGKKKGAKKK